MDDKIHKSLKFDTVSHIIHPKCRDFLWTNYISRFFHVGSEWLRYRLLGTALMCQIPPGKILKNHQNTDIFAPNKAFGDPEILNNN